MGNGKIDLGIRSPVREREYPYVLSFRCDEETVGHLTHVKRYMEEVVGTPALSNSDVVRTAIRFGHIFCLQKEAELEEKKRLQRSREEVKRELGASGDDSGVLIV